MYMKGVAQGMFTTQRIFRCFHKPKNTAPFPWPPSASHFPEALVHSFKDGLQHVGSR